MISLCPQSSFALLLFVLHSFSLNILLPICLLFSMAVGSSTREQANANEGEGYRSSAYV